MKNKDGAVKVTGAEFESVVSELQADFESHGKYAHGPGKDDDCPLCTFMDNITDNKDDFKKFAKYYIPVIQSINLLSLITGPDASDFRALSAILLVGIKIGRRQVQLEQMQASGLTE